MSLSFLKRESMEISRVIKKHISESTAQKLKFPNKDFFSKCDRIRSTVVTFTEEILNVKLHFFCTMKTTSLGRKEEE